MDGDFVIGAKTDNNIVTKGPLDIERSACPETFSQYFNDQTSF